MNENEEKFRTLLEFAPEAFFHADSTGNLITVNQNAVNLTGYSKEELLTMTMADLFSSENLIDKPLSYDLLNKTQTSTTEREITKKSGDHISIEMISKAMPDETIQCFARNISDRKQAETELKESEEKYRLLFENMPQGVFHQLADGTFTDINAAGLKMLGLSRDEFLSRTSYYPEWIVVNENFKILRPEKYPAMFALTSGKNTDQNVGIFNPEKKNYTWLNVNAKPQFRPGETNAFQVFVTMHDISGRKRNETLLAMRLHLIQYSLTHSINELLEEALNEAEKLSDSLIGFIHFVNDDQQHIQLRTWSSRTNAEFCNAEPSIKHYPIAEAGVWVDCVRELKPVIYNNYGELPNRKGLPKGHPEITRLLTIPIFRGKKIKAILGVGNKSNDYTQSDVQVVSILADLAWEIAERMIAEQALKVSTEKFKSIVESSPTAMYFYKLEDNNQLILLGANPASDKIIGISHKTLIGKTIEEAFPNLKETEIPELYKKVARGDLSFQSFEIRYQDERFSGFYNVHVFRTNPNEIAIDFVDISDWKKAEETLKESEYRLLELNATKDKFFSIIAHDLKSPFNSILGFSNLLVEQIQQKDYEGIEKYADIIQYSSQRALNLLMNLLEWSRSQTGKMEFKPEQIELISVVNKVVELSNDSAHEKSLTIAKDLPHNILVHADKAMLNTILRNLISNAIKFTPTGGTIIISAEQNQNEIMVKISDNGIGIEKNALDKLFRLDGSFSTPGTNNEKGTGLGLILCKEFIEKHKGRIWVESEKRKGSKFCFTLPMI